MTFIERDLAVIGAGPVGLCAPTASASAALSTAILARGEQRPRPDQPDEQLFPGHSSDAA